ncbi:hypothetical protein LB506_001937 [Fusarium annulatum]|nr:hypothetical protein LB506_001937 [Fusarium annulatum]
MSFGYCVGDVIAVLGLFERIAIELRNYKDAPTQFQELCVELDLLRGTLKRVLSLEPECDAEREAWEQIRAIVLCCAQPLQFIADKMRSKESSLGHFRTTRSLVSIGARLHWSMIDQADVEGFRKILLSQMTAINTLSSIQQRARIQRLVLQMNVSENRRTLLIEKYTNAIAGQASNILSITSKTQSTIDALASHTSVQAEIHSKQADEINQSLNSIEQNLRHMTWKSEHGTTVIRRQAAFITRQAQALFYLMQDIRKLFILCTFLAQSFDLWLIDSRILLDLRGQMKDMIRSIEAIPLHLTLDIVRLDDVHGESWALSLQACRTWERDALIRCVCNQKTRSKLHHTESLRSNASEDVQAVILKGSHSSKRCLNPKCAAMLQDEVLEFEDRQVWVKLLQPIEPIQDVEEAYRLLSEDPNHTMANAYVGLEILLAIGETISVDQIDIARNHLEVAVESGDKTRYTCYSPTF